MLKDRSYLCNNDKGYKGLKRDLREVNPFTDAELLPNECAQCRKLW